MLQTRRVQAREAEVGERIPEGSDFDLSILLMNDYVLLKYGTRFLAAKTQMHALQ